VARTCKHGFPLEVGEPWPAGELVVPGRCVVCYRRHFLKPQMAADRQRAERAGAKVAGAKPPARRGLGDVLAGGLKAVGVTPAAVRRWTGKPCGCKARQAKLNRWGWRAWAWLKRRLGRLIRG
jgi:hypothetical protein